MDIVYTNRIIIKIQGIQPNKNTCPIFIINDVR